MRCRRLRECRGASQLGRGGLDYASSEKKYHVTAYEDESFSHLHVMCLTYVGFHKADPSVDLQMPLEGAYRKTLELPFRK